MLPGRLTAELEPGTSQPECPICLSVYDAARPAKLLSCDHTCCSACLAHMVQEVLRSLGDEGADGAQAARPPSAVASGNHRRDLPGGSGPGALSAVQRAVRCPWCRCLTLLMPGASVSQLPDASPPPGSPVFIRLLAGNPAPYLSGGRRDTRDAVAAAKDGLLLPPQHLSLPTAARMWRAAPRSSREEVGEWMGAEEEGEHRHRKTWTRVCVVIVFSLSVLLVTYAITHGVSCSSRAFTMVRCG